MFAFYKVYLLSYNITFLFKKYNEILNDNDLFFDSLYKRMCTFVNISNFSFKSFVNNNNIYVDFLYVCVPLDEELFVL